VNPIMLVPLGLALALSAQAPQTVGTWTAVTTTTTPPLRQQGQMVYDPVRDVMFLTGGLPPGGGLPLSDVWEFSGTNWTQRLPANPLNLYQRPARFAFCTTRGRIIAVDGDSTLGGSPMALHEWTGSNFVTIASNAPLSRADYFDVAWDSSRNVLVMFGGGVAFADTWEWNGTTWTQRGTGGPPGRHDHRMVYDAARQRVVLYGGISYQGGIGYTDTWEWDGSVWRELFGIPSAGVTSRFGMTWDSSRQRSITFGGLLASTNNDTNRVSLYDGTAWSVLTTLGGPATIEGPAIAYDSLRNRTLSFGGIVGGGQFASLLSLDIRTGIVATFGPHGAGCPGPSGVATIAPENGTRPVLGSTLQLRFGSLANSPLALVFASIGFSDQSWNGQPLPLDLSVLGMPSCSLLISPGATQVLSNLGGFADWNIAVPAAPALDGQHFFVQGAVLASGFNAAGAVMSNSGQGVAGAL
jgi:hypothetical protein